MFIEARTLEHACVHTHTDGYVHMHAHACTCACADACVCVHVCAWVSVCTLGGGDWKDRKLDNVGREIETLFFEEFRL